MIKKKFYYYVTKWFMGMVKWNVDLYEQTVNRLYQEVRHQNFILGAKVVNVKKGSRKYSLVFIETKDGTVRVNVGRYYKDKDVVFNMEDIS